MTRAGAAGNDPQAKSAIRAESKRPRPTPLTPTAILHPVGQRQVLGHEPRRGQCHPAYPPELERMSEILFRVEYLDLLEGSIADASRVLSDSSSSSATLPTLKR